MHGRRIGSLGRDGTINLEYPHAKISVHCLSSGMASISISPLAQFANLYEVRRSPKKVMQYENQFPWINTRNFR